MADRMSAFLRRLILCGLFDQHRNNHAKNHQLRPLFPIRCDECNEFFYADYWPATPHQDKP